MSEVTLTIGGRHYTVSCADGEEAHIARLGQVIDGKLAQLGSTVGPNESRNFLFASLLLADDLHEKAKEMEGLQQAGGERLRAEVETLRQEKNELGDEIDALRAARQHSDNELAEARAETARMAGELEELRRAAPAGGGFLPLGADPDLAPALERFAEMLESCAAKLEGKAGAA